MLVLTRKCGQEIKIGDNIVIFIRKTATGSVRIGIEAPSDVPILRGEISTNNDATIEYKKSA